jgi:hypothetical protein
MSAIKDLDSSLCKIMLGDKDQRFLLIWKN